MGFEGVPKMLAGMVYAIVAFFVLVYLLRRGKFNRKIGYAFLAVSTIMGFVVFAPMIPQQFQLLILENTGIPGPAIPVVVMMVLFVLLTFVFGRIFCGYLCPVGAAQELAYSVPGRKLKITNKTVPIVFHLLFLVAFIILGMAFSIEVLAYLGFRQFFHLNVTSIFFYVFLALLISSAFVYRPFCRLFCPYGALLSLVSIKGLFKLRRNENCIDCEDCGEICPTNEAGRDDLKQECYLCNRCKETCPVDAIEYGRK